MRKGIEEIIRRYEKDNQNGVLNPSMEFLSTTTLSLQKVKELERYFLSNCYVWHDDDREKDILKDRVISTVDDMNRYGTDVFLFCGISWRASYNVFLDNNSAKEEIIEYSKSHTEDELKLHVTLLRYQMSFNNKDTLAFESMYDALPSIYTKRRMVTLLDDAIFIFSEYENSEKHSFYSVLVKDFCNNKEDSFAYSLLLQDVYEFDVYSTQLQMPDTVRLKDIMNEYNYGIREVSSQLPYNLYSFEEIKNHKHGEIVPHKVLHIFPHLIRQSVLKLNPYMKWFLDHYLDDKNSLRNVFECERTFCDNDLFNRMLEASGGLGFTIKSPFYRMFIRYSDAGIFFTSVVYTETMYNPLSSKNPPEPEPHKKSDVLQLWFTNDNHVMMGLKYSDKQKKSRWVPANIKTIYRKGKNNPLLMNMLHDFAKDMKLYFLLDVLHDFDTSAQFCTISFEDAMTYHNRAEYVNAKYSCITKLRKNFNKTNLNVSYVLNKVIHCVAENDYGRLASIKNVDFMNSFTRANDIKVEFFTKYYTEYKNYRKRYDDERDEWDEWDEGVVYTVRDYVSMALKQKETIPLNHSMNHICRDHDRLMEFAHEQMMPAIRIPSNSKFNRLREVLPSEYEWIKSKKRLARESSMQHHCVWSYGDYINGDHCAIYSFVDEECKYGDKPERYTIEFTCKKGKYYIAQMQKAYDRGGNKKLAEDINEYLKSA